MSKIWDSGCFGKKTYIKDDKENEVEAIENYKDPKQPPRSGTWEE